LIDLDAFAYAITIPIVVGYTYLSAIQDDLKVADFCLKETITPRFSGGTELKRPLWS